MSKEMHLEQTLHSTHSSPGLGLSETEGPFAQRELLHFMKEDNFKVFGKGV